MVNRTVIWRSFYDHFFTRNPPHQLDLGVLSEIEHRRSEAWDLERRLGFSRVEAGYF